MSFTPRRIIVVAVVGLLVALLTVTYAGPARKRAVSPEKPVAPVTPSPNLYATTQLEHYLSDDGIAYIRPGLNLKVNSIEIGTDRKPVIDVSITDDMKQPLDRLGQTTPGAISITVIMAWYNPDTRQMVNYNVRNVGGTTQADRDRTGTWTDLETGHAIYKFGSALPANFDMTKTHTLGMYASRNLQDILGKTYYDNIEYDFRPDGQAVTEKWDKINQAASCDNCHDPLAVHGGSRRDVKLCVMCHQPQTTDPDTGNTVDMKVMIHKIHFGPNLTKGYTIIGFGGSVHDFTHVTFPQDVRNCWNCHEGTDSRNKPSQSDVWYTKPGMVACGSCHDDVDFATGENHPGGIQTDDSACANCHQPESEMEFDASIKGAHTIPAKSKQLKGLKAEIVSVTDVVPGMTPTMVFKFTENDGTPVDATTLDRFAPYYAGPTTSYTKVTSGGTGSYDSTTGLTTYTFTTPIGTDVTGTLAFASDAYRWVNLVRGDGGPDVRVREAILNPVTYVAVTGEVNPRRMVVDIDNCNECHDHLSLHGGNRQTTLVCVICHNPLADDSARRPAEEGLPESISFQRMIHRIHTGEELTQPLIIYGFGNSRHDFSEVTFPGDRRNCEKCHVNNSQQVPPAKGADPVITLRDYFSPQGPGTAACLGCHDFEDAAAHAYLNTTMFPGSTKPSESCGVCHGENAEWAVDKVHAR